MELFIPDLKKAGGQYLQYHGLVEIKDSEASRGEVPLLNVSLKAAYVNNRVLLKGSWQAKLTGECSRCLEQTDYTLEESFEEEFIHLQAGENAKALNPHLDRDEQYFFKGERLSLDEYFRHAFVISQPLKILCSEECKGLCPVCGRDRNKYSCSCADNEIDYRWSLLEKLRK